MATQHFNDRTPAGVPVLSAQRGDYDLMQQRINDGQVIMTNGYLRVESPALVAASSITFDLNFSQTANSITEFKLQQNNAFLCNEVCVAIGIRLTADAVSSKRLETFPNDKLFTTAASLNAVRAFYNSRLAVRMGSTVLVDSIDMLAFQRIDTAQAGTLLFTASNQSSSFWGQNHAFKSLVPNWLFNGTNQNNLIVNLPESVTFTLATFTITADIILRGWNLQNGGTQRSSI